MNSLQKNELSDLWYEKESEYKQGNIYPDFLIALLSSCTAQPLVKYLGGQLSALGYNPDFYVAPYNQIIQTCLSCKTVLPPKTKLVIVIWRIEDLFLYELEKFIDNERKVKSIVLKKTHAMQNALLQLTNSGYHVIVTLPGLPYPPHISLYDWKTMELVSEFHRSILETWNKWLKLRPEIFSINIDFIGSCFGLSEVLDNRTWYLFKQPWKEMFWCNIALEVTRMMKAMSGTAIKCVALDCDGVLWGGIVGEDGINGIKLSNDFPGIVYKDVQRYLQNLRKKGVFLALLSKNNNDDVWEVFDKHDEMVLKRNDISAYSIDWNPKTLGIEKIAKQLNIGIDSILFIDDSHFEIEGMNKTHPEIKCFEVPPEISNYLEYLKTQNFFDSITLTQEDQNRIQMVQIEEKRKQLQKQMLYDDFLKTLKLRITVKLAEPIHIDRITQLVNKTNQFNLTTRRYSNSDIRSMIESDNCFVFIMWADDAFGDYGLTGVVIGEIKNNCFMLDSFLLSCRVLGRGIETAFLSSVRNEIIARENVESCRAEYIPTAKNTPIASFLEQHNFNKGEKNYWTAKLNELPNCPNHIICS